MNKQKKGFTLVELIIVITILAILGTIGFISFQGYTLNSRDTNRLSTIKKMQNGLDMYFVKTLNYPMPENISGTGMIGTDITNYVGIIGNEISNKIGFSKTPIDPLSNTNYIYGISVNSKKYQIGITMENFQSNIILPIAYANNYKVKVVGNYIYPLKIGTKIYSLPSLIFVGTGITNSDTFTGFIINGGQNLPYRIDGTGENIQTISEVLQEITGTGGLTLTGIDTSVLYDSTQSFIAGDTKILESTFGLQKDNLGQIIYGNDYLYNLSGVSNTSPISTTINGVCGEDDGQRILTGPNATHPLCSVGTPTVVNYSSSLKQRTWSCLGSGEPIGATDNCITYKLMPVQPVGP